MSYKLQVGRGAERTLGRLPEKAAAALVEFLIGDLVASPHRCGKPLLRELSGYLAARRGPYRVVYQIDDVRRVVNVVRIDHRADVYRSS